ELGQPLDKSNPAIEQKNSQAHSRNSDERNRNRVNLDATQDRKRNLCFVTEPGEDVRGVLGEPDTARCNRERRAECELPNKEKRHQAAQLSRTVNLRKVTIRTSGTGQGCSEFGPDKPIADD